MYEIKITKEFHNWQYGIFIIFCMSKSLGDEYSFFTGSSFFIKTYDKTS